ncbi:MAG TPA: elongation factor P [Magnetospirillaceae bacterium]|nr:elongation factor P [Magnetospirillaceae bacterium]
MIRGGDIAKGTVLLINGHPHIVVDREFVNPGKGAAFARLKAKNMRNGNVVTQTIKTQDTVEDAQVDLVDCQYQYGDAETFVFMNNENFEQYFIPCVGHEDRRYYLMEGETYTIVFWEHEAIDIRIPYKMVFTVTESENYIRGDTVSGATKPVVCETGLVVRVPLFIKQGEKILVNTETNEYQERVNE